MAYPTEKPSGQYELRQYDFAVNDINKLPIDEYRFKNGYKNADESTIESVPDAHNHNWLFDLLHRNLRYTQEVAEENKAQLETKLATPTTIGQIKVGYGLEITSNGVLSVSKSVAEDANIVSYDLPVGSYMLWSGKNTPEYFIEPSGQELLRSSYPELWQFAQDNDLIGTLFGEGDGSTTFTVTDIRGNFISIANSNDKVGKFTQAGLPNIKATAVPGGDGTGTCYPIHIRQASGAFYTTENGTVMQRSERVGSKTFGLGFDASKSNSIYGKSSTVTPANWGLKIILKALPTPPSNAVPTGTILDYTGLVAPDGYIIANGAELSRATFSQLWNWAVSNNLVVNQSSIPSTAHGYYGTGDGSTTFTIPDLRGVFKRSADLASNRGGADAREYQADGLPNITGNLNLSRAFYNGASGAFSIGTQTTKAETDAHSFINYNNATFNASKSNAIYGKSSYVQPKSVSLIPILKY